MFHYVKIVCKENASSDNSCSTTMRTTLNHQNSDYTLPWPPHSRPHNISAFNIWALWLNYNIWALWLNYNIWASCSILQYLGLMFSTSYRDRKKSSIQIMIMYYVGVSLSKKCSTWIASKIFVTFDVYSQVMRMRKW